MSRRRPQSTFPLFRAMTKEEQREYLLSFASGCIDACPTHFARLVEIYFDATPDEQRSRLSAMFGLDDK
jgi:hypothetical protein